VAAQISGFPRRAGVASNFHQFGDTDFGRYETGRDMMNRVVAFFLSLFLILTVASGIGAEETSDQFRRFGKIALYHPAVHPAHVVLFVSGDGGWRTRWSTRPAKSRLSVHSLSASTSPTILSSSNDHPSPVCILQQISNY